MLVPLYSILQKLHLLDTLAGLFTLVYSTSQPPLLRLDAHGLLRHAPA